MPSLGGWEYVALLALMVGLLFAALVSIFKHPTASGTMKALWILISFFFPILGPILWFVIGKRTSTESAA